MASLLLAPYTVHLPVLLRTLVLTVLVVPVVSYALVPLLTKAHGAARRRAGRHSRSAVV
ncbi:hypothetical protein ACIGXM_30905 [Kitasatospora sp. NPDC052896]|uniref:hypothetical protein n=1 Tax=Kitasatospora sp. NPDC052896 TaxID=3364061 RepID=UPI0037C5C6D8